MIDPVLERHGVTSSEGFCTVREKCQNVCLYVHDGVSGKSVDLTPSEARYIASKLRRLARRVEEKNA